MTLSEFLWIQIESENSKTPQKSIFLLPTTLVTFTLCCLNIRSFLITNNPPKVLLHSQVQSFIQVSFSHPPTNFHLEGYNPCKWKPVVSNKSLTLIAIAKQCAAQKGHGKKDERKPDNRRDSIKTGSPQGADRNELTSSSSSAARSHWILSFLHAPIGKPIGL